MARAICIFLAWGGAGVARAFPVPPGSPPTSYPRDLVSVTPRARDLDYPLVPSESFACPERAPGAVRIAARRPEFPGCPETAVGKLDQPPLPPAPSAPPDRAPRGGGRAA
eukprot:gene19012-biopygen5468